MANTTNPEKVRAEHRWPAVLGLLVALGLYATLPIVFFPVVRYTVVGIGLVMLIPLLILNPHHLHKETTWSKRLATGQALLLVTANGVVLVQLIILLTAKGSDDGPGILLAALQIWVTNIIAFALVFWELDRGGPVSRRHTKRKDLPPADFRFPRYLFSSPLKSKNWGCWPVGPGVIKSPSYQ